MIECKASALGAHNALFVPAGTLFSFTSEAACFGQTLLLDPSEAPHWPQAPLLLRVREPKAQLTLTHYIEAIQNEIKDDQPHAAMAAAAHAQLMCVWARRYAGPPPSRPSASMRLLRRFSALLAGADSHAEPMTSMADYAAELGVTPTHLTRVCKASCGATAADILTEHTLQRARRMLENDKLKAVLVSERLGFSSPAYFTRFIKTHTGKTPGQLRKLDAPAQLNETF